MSTLSGNRVVPKSITNNSSGERTIALDLLLNNDCPVTNNGTLKITGLISGTRGLDIRGNGVLELSNDNTYSGRTSIRSGTVKITGSGRLGAGNYAGLLVVNGTLDHSSSRDQIISGNVSTYKNFPSLGVYNPNCKIIVNGPGILHFRNPFGYNLFDGTLQINSGAYVKVGNNDAINTPSQGLGTGSIHAVTSIISNGTLEFNRGTGSSVANVNGVISGSGLISLTGASSLIMAGGGDFSGNVLLNAGTALTLNRIMNSAIFENNGTLTLNVTSSWNPNYVFNTTINGNTTSLIYSTDYVAGTSIGAANITAQVQSAGLGNDASEFSGFVPGRIALVQRGVQSFQVKVNNAIAAGASAVIIYNNTTGLTTPSVTTNIPVVMITQSLGQQFVAALNATTVSCRIDTTSSSVPFSNTISGNGTIVKSGDTTLFMNIGSAYTGIISITGGVLRVNNTNGLGGATSIRPSTGAFEALGNIIVANPFSLGGTGVSSGGAIRNISDNNTISGPIALTAASRINSDAGILTLSSEGTLTGTFGLTFGGAGNINVSRPISTMTGTVTKDGAGTVVLSAANTYTGITTISGGTLRFATVSSLYNNATASWTKTNIIVNTGATFAINVGGTNEFTTTNVGTLLTNLLTTISNNGLRSGSSIGFDTTNSAADFTISNNITNSTGTGAGAVRVVKLGTGTLVLSGTSNTYTGGTVINGGTLKAGNSTCFGTGTITLNAGATLDRAGFTITNTIVNNGGTIIN